MFIVELLIGMILGVAGPGLLIHRHDFRLGVAAFVTAIMAIIILALPIGLGARAALAVGLGLGFLVCASVKAGRDTVTSGGDDGGAPIDNAGCQ